MHPIEKAFSNKAFIAYVPASHAKDTKSIESAVALCHSGVDMLEVGLAFSDPIADGPVIQQAMQKTIQNKIGLDEAIGFIKKIKQKIKTPIVIFSYYNPIINAGPSFYQKAQRAGVDGILIVDLPIEESQAHIDHCHKHQLTPIQMISSTSSPERIKVIAQKAEGFIYYSCRKGTTGIKSNLPDNFTKQIKTIKAQTQLPIAAGFGIASKDVAKQVIEHADGFVVGSYFVNAYNQGQSTKAIAALAQHIDPRNAL
jgi:tryptophan synthase alpha chain